MSDFFHKSCYTTRSSGYKYRTLSTNTGQQKKRESTENNTLDRKFKELRNAITLRVDKEVADTHKARDFIYDKFAKVDAKVDSILELQSNVSSLRYDLNSAGIALTEILSKVERLDAISAANSFQSQRTYKSNAPIKEEVDDRTSIVTHI